MDQKYNNTPKVMTAEPMTAERMTQHVVMTIED
jgi:hypothetical protein